MICDLCGIAFCFPGPSFVSGPPSTFAVGSFFTALAELVFFEVERALDAVGTDKPCALTEFRYSHVFPLE